jgi:hypothetical protein
MVIRRWDSMLCRYLIAVKFAVIRTLRGAASRADEASMDVDETDRGARHESTGQSHSALPNSRAAAGLGRAKKAKAEGPCPSTVMVDHH